MSHISSTSTYHSLPPSLTISQRQPSRSTPLRITPSHGSSICDPTADWDPTIARREIDFHDILKKSGEQLDEADKIARAQGWKRRVYDDGPTIAFEKFASKLSWIADWYLKRISPVQADDETVGEQMSVADDPSGVRDGFVDKAFESAWIDLMSFQDAGLFESFDLNCL